MKVNSKTKTSGLFNATPIKATPSPLATRLLLAALLGIASMLPLPAQNAVLTGAIGGRVVHLDESK